LKRLALILALPVCLGGCIFLTPPTGLRVGSHVNEFPAPQTGGAIELNEFKAPDFSVIFPTIWSVSQSLDVVSQRDGKSIRRVSIGQAAANGEVEGIQVTNILQTLDPDPTKNLNMLSDSVLVSLQAGLTQDAKLVMRENKFLDGEKAVGMEVAGTTQDLQDPNTGQVIQGRPMHFLAYAAWRNKRGYIVVISTIESRWEPLKDLFTGMMDQFKWQPGAPVEACAALTDGTVSGTVILDPGATSLPDRPASGAATDRPASGAMTDRPASGAMTDGQATPPQLIYLPCFPDAPASAQATPAASAAASPGP
jgi:hypothetical protein